MAEKQDKKKGGGPDVTALKAAAAARKAAKAKEADAVDSGGDDISAGPVPEPRLSIHYREKVVPALKEKFALKNALAVPRIDKIVISMGLGKIATAGGADAKSKFEQCEKELAVIAGQRPVRCKAKKSVANFKVREGQETGLKVTLRGKRMYEFLDRLISLTFPRVKDFRGVSPEGFDKSGNYNFGFTEQTVFAEVDSATVTFQQGMNLTLCTTAGSKEKGRELLKQFGFPFRDDAKQD
jgi:large subunit ribosomal protein L5